MASLTIDALRAREASRVFRVPGPTKRIALRSDHALFLCPPTGSWAIVPTSLAGSIENILSAAQSGDLDRIPDADTSELVQDLYAAGLLSIRGKASWQGVDFDNAQARVNTLILKMVGHCNIACTYCYDFSEETFKSKLSVEQATRAIDQALPLAGPTLNVLFHGGEPLLAFRRIQAITEYALTRTKETGQQILFSIQTNGTRFTDEIVDFLIAHEFSVGVSLDGPPEFNDVHRVTFQGGGTGEPILRNLKKYTGLRQRLGVLTTVTQANCGSLRDIARYFRDFGVERWDITVFQDSGRAANKASRFAPDSETLIAGYRDLLDGVEAGEFDTMEVRPVLHYVRNLLNFERRNMCLRNGCGAAKELVSISADGTIESCDCVANPALSLGHMQRNSLAEAVASPAATRIRTRTVDALQPCRTCDWRIFCGGTCLAKAGDVHAIDESECRLSLALFPDILQRLARSDKLVRYVERFSRPVAAGRPEPA